MPYLIRLACCALLALGWTAAPPASASEHFHTCTGFITTLPATIGSPGVWCFDRDLSTSIASGNAITIDANDVTIDCNGFKLGGLAAGNASMAKGIASAGQDHVRVRNCNVRGFRDGIYLYGGVGGLIEDNRLDNNLVSGINQSTLDGLVRRNHVLGTGLASSPTAYGIWAGGGSTMDNVIVGVHAAQPIGIAGITGTARGNAISGLVPTAGGMAYGITCGSTTISALIQDNRITATSPTSGRAIDCPSANNTAIVCRDNVVVKFATAQFGCDATYNNLVRP